MPSLPCAPCCCLLPLPGCCLLLFYLLFKRWKKAGLLASLTLILFFSYGHIYAAARLLNLGSLPLGRHRLLFPLFLVLWAVLVWLIARTKGDLRTGTQTANIIALIALLFPLIGFIQYSVNVRAAPAVGSQDARLLPSRLSASIEAGYLLHHLGWLRPR